MLKMSFSRDEKIVNYLMIKSKSLSDYGLFHGKTGVALTVLLYGIHKNNNIYIEFSIELINDVLTNLPDIDLLSFEFGLLGIGWAIEYAMTLDSNFIVYADSLNVIDQKVNFVKKQENVCFASKNNTMGLLHYVLARINGAKVRREDILPYSINFVYELYKQVSVESPSCAYIKSVIEYNRIYNPDIRIFTNKANLDTVNINNLSIVDGLSNKLLNFIFDDK